MYREAVRRDPSFAVSLGKLARTYRREGNPEAAREALQPFLTADQPEVAWWARRLDAQAYDVEGRYLDALEASRGVVENARELGRDDFLLWALNDTGAWANATGAYGEAEEVFSELYRAKEYSMFGMLTAYGEQERFDNMSRVRAEAAEAIHSAPESLRGRREGQVHFADGFIAWYRDGDAEGTVRLFGEGRAVLRMRETTFLSNEETLALIEVGQAADALAIISRREERQSQSVRHVLAHDVWYLRGRAYEALGEPEQALESYQRLLDVAGDGVREVVLFRDTPERVARLRGDP
jgi:tetratricopeptide (TPR) repeat protein